MGRRLVSAVVAGTALAVFPPGAAVVAGELVYTPVNPSFGGSSFNSQHLLGLANAQNEFKDDGKDGGPAGLSPTRRFLQQLQARLYSQLAEQVSEAIFGENAQDSGTLVFDDQTISFEKTPTEIKLTVFDSATGQTTEIVIPQVQAN